MELLRRPWLFGCWSSSSRLSCFLSSCWRILLNWLKAALSLKIKSIWWDCKKSVLKFTIFGFKLRGLELEVGGLIHISLLDYKELVRMHAIIFNNIKKWFKSGIHKSGIRTSEIRTSGIRTSGIITSGIRNSGVRTSGVRKSEIRKSRIRISGIHISGIRNFGIHKSELRKSGIRKNHKKSQLNFLKWSKK